MNFRALNTSLVSQFVVYGYHKTAFFTTVRNLNLNINMPAQQKKEKATFATVVVQEIYRRLFLTYGNFLTSFSRKERQNHQERTKKSIVSGHKIVEKNEKRTIFHHLTLCCFLFSSNLA